MNMKGEARIAGAGSTEDVPACFSFGIKLPQVDLLHYVSPFDSQVIDGQIEWRWRAAPVDNRIISERTATKNARFP